MDTKYLFLVIIIVAIECHVQDNLFALSHYHPGKRSGV